MKKKLGYSWQAFLVICTVLFIEWKQTDRITAAFLCWTFILVYYCLKTAGINACPTEGNGFYGNTASFFMLLAYLTASLDVRFIHISDNIPVKTRINAVTAYAWLIVCRITITDICCWLPSRTFLIPPRLQRPSFTKAHPLTPAFTFISQNRRFLSGLRHITSAAALIAGQTAMNSRLSMIAAAPAVLLTLYESTKAFGIKQNSTEQQGSMPQ